MSEEYILNAEGNFFLQDDLSEVFEWITCTGVGDIALPQGDKTPLYCPKPLHSGEYEIVGFVTGDIGAGTYSLEKPLASVWNVLIELKCQFQGRVNWVCRGSRVDPLNYEVAALLLKSDFNTKGISNPVRTPEGTSARVNTTGGVNFTHLMMIYRLNISRHTLTNPMVGLGVYFLPQQCEDRAGDARDVLQVGIIGCILADEEGYLYESEIKKTFDGSTWAAVGTDPYAYGGGTKALWIFETVDGMKFLVFRMTPVVGHGPECAYSTDLGDSWTNVEMDPVHGIGINACDLAAAKVVAVGTLGRIYTSMDQGANWTIAVAGELGTETLRDVNFYNKRQGYAVGDSARFLYTENGAVNWFAGTCALAAGADLLSVATNMKGHVFVTTNDGRVLVSEDEGDNWDTRLDMGAGTIPWIKFDWEADYVGWLIHNPAVGRGQIYRSEDGGASWQQITGMPLNLGLNWGHIGDQNKVIVVGNDEPLDENIFVASTSPTI